MLDIYTNWKKNVVSMQMQRYTYMYTGTLSTGMFAIRAEREYVESEDFMKAVRKVSDSKKLETKLDYKQI